ILAIQVENEKERLRVENDLVRDLKEYLGYSNLAKDFYVFTYPDKLTSKILDTQIATEYLKKSKAHFMIYGNVSERFLENRNNYIFKLHGIVRHIPISSLIQKNLEDDFSRSLPRRVVFEEGQEMLGFEFTTEVTGYVIKLIIGSAALVSKDLQLSYSLLKELREELAILPQRTIMVEEIQKRTERRLIENLSYKIDYLYYQYSKTRAEERLFETESLLEELATLDSSNVFMLNSKAVLLFKKKKIEEAIKTLESRPVAVARLDVLCKYNLGFLYAYNGEFDKSLEMYRQANYGTLEGGTLNDIEMFITDEIEKNPSLIQLIFFRGLINHKVKKDSVLAKKDFEDFLRISTEQYFKNLRQLAMKYLEELEV
ncbi:MAG: hypothetical protein Q8P39_03725, partial [Candidatus Yanofskybacteria bacterium]|nr:hypothetical protein [Candidatus Yanofskybacteria bacterium]